MDNSKEMPGMLPPAKSPIETHGANFNTAAFQRQRILNHLTTIGPFTTLDARRDLDVMHPATRVMELRRQGHDIQTHWYVDCTDRGKPHRVARYVLMKRAGEGLIDDTA